MRVIADKVVMIRPLSFRSNEETLESNAFQQKLVEDKNILQNAQAEFDSLCALLEKNGIEVLRFEEEPGADTPDALFPNNWLASFPDKKIFVFPMMPKNRQREYREDIVSAVSRDSAVVDLRYLQDKSQFLEGTGSLIIDHLNREAYACLSGRTNIEAIKEFERSSGYKVLFFSAVDENGLEIYHTNVMMAFGAKVVVLCADAIPNKDDRERLIKHLEARNKKILFISYQQMLSFAGNMLLLQNKTGQRFWLASHRAIAALNSDQKKLLTEDGQILSAAIPTIETVGGGGVRCMLAEIF